MDQHNILESFGEQARKMYGPMVSFNKVILKNAERLTEYSLNTIKTYAEMGINQLHEASKVQDASTLSNFSAKQAEWLNGLSKQMLEDAQQLTELGNDLRNDVVKVMSEAYAQANAAAEAASAKVEKVIKVKQPA